MLRWRRNKVALRRDVSSPQLCQAFVNGRCVDRHKEAWFPVAEKRVMELFNVARKAGCRVMKCGSLLQ